MDLTPELKQWIDSMSYKELLWRWRNATIVETGSARQYWVERMAHLRRNGANHAEVVDEIASIENLNP